MARVLVLSLVYRPDTVSTANLLGEIVDGLVGKGHQVSVLTSIPHYNPSAEVRAQSAYRTSLLRWFTVTSEGGVRVIRIAMPRKGRRKWLRLFDYAWMHLFTTILARPLVGPVDVVLVPSPPPSLGINGYLIAKLLGGRLVYDVREVWSDLPIRIGRIRKKLIMGTLRLIEDFVYGKSTAITSIARSFNQALTKRGVPESKLFFTPNFVDVEWLQPRSHDTAFARENGLTGKYVAFYAGNIGLTQGLGILVDVAAQLEKAAPDIVVVVVGDGAGRNAFETAMRESGVGNLRLLPLQPYNRVPETYATAHVCLSPMQRGFSYNTVPSKIYTAMAAGRPVISACEADTESAQLILESQSGIVVEPESAEQMVAAILRLHADRDLGKRMGENGRQLVVDQYSRTSVVDTYDRMIRTVTGQ